MSNLICEVQNNGFDYEIDLFDKKKIRETFWQSFVQNPNLTYPSTISIDLLYLSEIIYYCDRNFERQFGVDGWKREFKLKIPVINLEKFKSLSVVFEKMLNFLTGDIWDLEFMERHETEREKSLMKKVEGKKKKECKGVCMFSGGMDSFIGVSDLIREEQNYIFVSHYGGGKGTKEFQDNLKYKIIEQSNSTYEENNFFQFYLAAVDGLEDTTRSRSFMFFSHAIAIASSVSAEVLMVPENGFISLNVPLSPARKGSSSTRTTHPYYFKLFQEIIDCLELNINIENPYKFMTKGQMLEKAYNKDFIHQNITHTMSCSHPDQGRYIGLTSAVHCGYCLPCSIRRAAILRGVGIDKTKYRFEKYETPEASQNFNALRMSLNLNEKITEFKIQENGVIEENIKEFSEVYTKGLDELRIFLEGIR